LKLLLRDELLEFNLPLRKLDFFGVIEILNVLIELKEKQRHVFRLEGCFLLEVLLLSTELDARKETASLEEIHQHVAEGLDCVLGAGSCVGAEVLSLRWVPTEQYLMS
jgi:hypothetical protein